MRIGNMRRAEGLIYEAIRGMICISYVVGNHAVMETRGSSGQRMGGIKIGGVALEDRRNRYRFRRTGILPYCRQ